MLFAFAAPTKSFLVSAENEEGLATAINRDLSVPHLAEFAQQHYTQGIVVVEAHNLPEAARKVRSETELHVVMPDLPMWQDPHNLSPEKEELR